ncbi:MAG: polysaccharide biosynthesis C-terminal domain-containing protein [Eubacteriales bacterium]|nr:polysaccharide biosynthesis C-terminal domain-containing protein [Eubacteriales bacterium]
MNQYKRLLGNTLIFTIGTFSSKLLVFFMMRFYTGILSPDEFGIADLIIKTTNILYPIVSVSIGQAVIRYGLERATDKPRVFTTGITTILCGFVLSIPFNPIFSFIHLTTSTGADITMDPYTGLIYLYVLTACLQNCCSQFIRSQGMVKLYAVDGIFRTAVTIALNVLYLSVFRWNIFGYVFSIICSDALSTVCLFFIARLWRFIQPRSLTRHGFRTMISYALPLVPAQILVFLIGYISQFMLGNMASTAVSGLYSAAYRIPTMITLVASIFIDAWQLSSINDNTREEQITFFSNVGNMFASIVLLIASGAIMCAKLAISILTDPAYFSAWTYVPLLALSASFSCLSSFQNSIYTLEKQTFRSFLSTAFTAIINIGLNLLLIPHIAGMGAAISALVSYGFLFLYRAWDTRRLLPVHWKRRRMLVTIALTALQAMLMLLEPPLWPLWQGILFGLVFLLNCRELLTGVNKLLRRA